MLTDIELETSQLVFSIEKEIVLMELRQNLEKLAKIEDLIRKNIIVNQVVLDSYKPAEDFVSPPKKKIRLA